MFHLVKISTFYTEEERYSIYTKYQILPARQTQLKCYFANFDTRHFMSLLRITIQF